MDHRKPTSTPGIEVRASSIRLRFTDQHGKRQTPRLVDTAGCAVKPTAGNIRAAEKLLAAVKASIAIGTYKESDFFRMTPPSIKDDPPTSASTLEEQLDTWLTGLNVAKSTRAGYEVAVRFCKQAPADGAGTLLASVPITKLVFSQIRHALAAGASRHRRGKVDADKPAKPLSAKTRNNYLAALRAALDLAVDDEVIEKNPSGEGKKLRNKVQHARPDPFALEELEAIIELIRAKSPEAGDYAEFWGYTGLRTSEINGLLWEDVDLRANSFRVHRANVRGNEKDTTKTNTERDVPIDPRARAALERQRARTQLAGAHVWLNSLDGKPWDDERDFSRSHFKPALKALRIRYRRAYNLRHTRATVLLKLGINPALAAKWMGHSVQTFFSRYARWIEETRDASEVAKLQALAPAEIGPKLAQTGS